MPTETENEQRDVNTAPLTDEELGELGWLAAEGRKALGLTKRDAEHRLDDYLWDRGWFVPSREVYSR